MRLTKVFVHILKGPWSKDVPSLKSLIWTLTSTMSNLTASEPVMKTSWWFDDFFLSDFVIKKFGKSHWYHKSKDVSSLKSLIWTLTSTMSYLTASEPVMKTGPEVLGNRQPQMTYVKSYLTFPNLDFYRNYFVLAKCQWNHRCCQWTHCCCSVKK